MSTKIRKFCPRVRAAFGRALPGVCVADIEAWYGLRLNAPPDMRIAAFLAARGFRSLRQLRRAFHGEAREVAQSRRVFVSVHAEDHAKVLDLHKLTRHPKIALDFYECSLRAPFQSPAAVLAQEIIQEKIARAAIVVCVVGSGSRWQDWVDWELRTGLELRKGVCVVRHPRARGRTPEILHAIGAPVATWDRMEILAAIECAAALI